METFNAQPYLDMPIEKLKEEYFKLPKPYRKALYGILPPDRKAVMRPLIEARRGIFRDEQGGIIRSKEWIQTRLADLKSKEEDLQRRLKNVKAEIKYRELELKDKRKGVEE